MSPSQFEDDVLLYVSYVERKLDRRALAIAVEYAEVITDNQACCIALLLYPYEMTIKMTINSLHVFRRPDVTLSKLGMQLSVEAQQQTIQSFQLVLMEGKLT